MDGDSGTLLAMAVAATAVVGGAIYWASTFSGKREVFLDKTRQKVVLSDKIQLSHDTFIFRFALPSKSMVLGLPVGKHFKVFAPSPKGSVAGKWNGLDDEEQSRDEIERKYTPTTSDDDLGRVDLVIKVYRPGKTYSPPRDRFPDGGKLSQYVDSLPIGGELEIQGPFGHIEYLGSGVFNVGRKDQEPVNSVGMVAGGTGITPMLQIAAAILKDPKDRTVIHLLFANQSEEDILVREMLEGLKKQHGKRFNLHYTLDRPPAKWSGYSGFVTDAMLSDCMPPPGGSCVLMCGPPIMIDKAVRPNLEKLGFKKTQIYAF
uniref:NADH-cytochrome b5 reductase n=1 Tax=Hemiselmis tepida TaxID=464990 RepID=A0A7S0YZ56_9CRYP